MGEIILTTNVKREKGYLYYVASNTAGNLVVCKALLQRGGSKKKANKDREFG